MKKPVVNPLARAVAAYADVERLGRQVKRSVEKAKGDPFGFAFKVAKAITPDWPTTSRLRTSAGSPTTPRGKLLSWKRKMDRAAIQKGAFGSPKAAADMGAQRTSPPTRTSR